MANDANCFALSEAVDGAAKEADVVFGVIIGTGVGGGLVINHQVLDGPNSIAGEWGHNPMPVSVAGSERRPCYCGRHNCVETFLSGEGLVNTFRQLGGQAENAQQVAERAAQQETLAQQALQRYQQQLAAALAVVINIVDPDVVVLGGGLSNIDSLYGTVPALWQEYIFSDQADNQLRKALHGDSSGVRGAAWLCPIGPRE